MATPRPGTHTVGPSDGRLEVHTFRDGVAQKVGHDLIIDVTGWEATVAVDDAGTIASVALEVDPRSLHVREGLRGVKPLTDKDRADIRGSIDGKILGGQPIAFRSTSATADGATLSVEGELTMAGATRPARGRLALDDDGHVRGTVSVTQSEWGIKPYRALMGALKVRDAVDVVFDVPLPGV